MFAIGDRIDQKYSVEEVLGGGGMGVVLRVSTADGAEHALKYCTDPDPDQRRRFAREVRIMERIDHPNVMPVTESNLEHDPPYFLMPVATNSLAEEIDQLKGNENAALGAIRQIGAGVEAIHAAGATHRDIKPLNALRMPDGTICVSDLGLAKLNERDTTTLTQTSMSLGTFVYAAPEQFLPGGTRDADRRTDVFQVAKTLYHLLTGDVPHLIDPSKVEPGLAHIIQRATRIGPNERYDSVGDFLEAITAHELSKDQFAHPTDAFGALIKEARDLVEVGNYNEDQLRRLVDLIEALSENSKEVIAMVEQVPEELLAMLAANMDEDAERLARLYVRAVDDSIGGYGFEHAETVARRLRILFDASSFPGVRALALEGTLIAGVRLNRWAAMDAFDAMLQKVRDGAVAVAAAEMLRRRLGEYRQVADRIEAPKLHPAIRRVRAVALGDESGPSGTNP